MTRQTKKARGAMGKKQQEARHFDFSGHIGHFPHLYLSQGFHQINFIWRCMSSQQDGDENYLKDRFFVPWCDWERDPSHVTLRFLSLPLWSVFWCNLSSLAEGWAPCGFVWDKLGFGITVKFDTFMDLDTNINQSIILYWYSPYSQITICLIGL